MSQISRVMVKKKSSFNQEALELLKAMHHELNLKGIENIDVINVYDMATKDEKFVELCIKNVFQEPMVDEVVYQEDLKQYDFILGIQPLPGQFDQRAQSAKECIEIISLNNSPQIKTGKFIGVIGHLTEMEKAKMTDYLINPVEMTTLDTFIPEQFFENEKSDMDHQEPLFHEAFITLNPMALKDIYGCSNLAMSYDDFKLIQKYFISESRNPTLTEIKVLDTYWSDHCRHTTFNTQIEEIKVEKHPLNEPVKKSLASYLSLREEIYGHKNLKKPVTLMDLATINVKKERKDGGLLDLDISEEINACSIHVDVAIKKEDGQLSTEPFLLMFKNETHNHPTEIEPFGGAATCLGGAIRDPLSGRSYVYQGMRITGAANPLERVEATLKGKLPQKVISKTAAKGFSSYGNQIGLSTGLVKEIYHPGFVAKRMEVGAVIGAAPKKNVKRLNPEGGDLVLLVGGPTGRDGIGGATGSSKAHNKSSLTSCGAEVQKGNPPEERKLQRFFRNEAIAKKIKRCNDFGAGGVSVAIGELAESITVDLDKISTKYSGLTGMEIAISESQERMAIVISKEDLNFVQEKAKEENLEARVVATIEDHGRLIMTYKGREILNIKRSFIETNGANRMTKATIKAPCKDHIDYKSDKKKGLLNPDFNEMTDEIARQSVEETLKAHLSSLNVCSQKGLVEQFDSTIGSGTMLLPYGGKHQMTPSQSMVAKIPVLSGQSKTASVMTYGYDPYIGEISPYHGGYYAVVDAISKMVASGCDLEGIRFSFQEYFRRLGDNHDYWGEPTAALLGAFEALKSFETAAIGGKDSMSGTYENYHVPPTLIAFAVNTLSIDDVITPEIKTHQSYIYQLKIEQKDGQVYNLNALKKAYQKINEMNQKKLVKSLYAISNQGVLPSIALMGFGNEIGIKIDKNYKKEDLFEMQIGGLLIEVNKADRQGFEREIGEFNQFEQSVSFVMVGETIKDGFIHYKSESMALETLKKVWEKPFEALYPVFEDAIYKDKGYQKEMMKKIEKQITNDSSFIEDPLKTTYILDETMKKEKAHQVNVYIPVFPGTNCEYDTERAFKKKGAHVKIEVFNNQSPEEIRNSIKKMVDCINKSQIIVLAGGFSAGDEPEGSGKFIASVFRNPDVQKSTERFLEKGGLMLGICNGFQALIKLGLLPYGRFVDMNETMPTLTFNHINRHISKVSPVRIVNTHSPWLSGHEKGDVYMTAFSHGEGRFYCNKEALERLVKNHQVATQYSDRDGHSELSKQININGSVACIEGIYSPNGQIYGKMGHIERMDVDLYKNIYQNEMVEIIRSGIEHFIKK